MHSEADPNDTRFAPAGVTLHRNAHFMARSTGFSDEFTWGQLVERVVEIIERMGGHLDFFQNREI